MSGPRTLRIALHQIDPTVGDLDGNERLIREGIAAARDAGAQLSLFPELAVTGYPPEDLLFKEHFLAGARAAVERIAADATDHVVVAGFPERAEDVFNAAAVMAGGAVRAIYRKVLLPNYGVFDEQRYFQDGAGGGILELGDLRLGITICEDIWEPGPPVWEETMAGADLVLNLSASPYHAGKGVQRERMVAQRARDAMAAFAFCAQAGGQDELVFDGHSFVCDHAGEIVARAAQFEPELLVADLDLAASAAARLRDTSHRPGARRAHADRAAVTLARLPEPAPARGPAPAPRVAALLEPVEAEIHAALVLGLRAYVAKNGFGRVVLGLSGGIDSALVAAIAVDALGADRVTAVIMPSPYSSPDTQDDARTLAGELGIETIELSIRAPMEAYDAMLAETFAGRAPDVTEENLQARIRGNLLMALSNKFGWLVLATGNKSEMSVGYSTLYGDLAGGLAVIKDCPKTLVYRLSEHRRLPRSIIDRAPSAELRAGQTDQDSLPPYPILDRILAGYVEGDLGRDDLVAQGLPAAEVDRVIALVDRAEYKRRQAPPGIKISTRAFGRDRRMPITNRYGG